MIIVISDLFILPGPWTLFIAVIIGIFGIGAGVIRCLVGNPNAAVLVVSAALFTVLSEFLQNAWVALFFNIPIIVAFATGIPSMVAAVANNLVLFTTTRLRIIKLIQEPTTK